METPWYCEEDEFELARKCATSIERVLTQDGWREEKTLQRLRVYYAGDVGSLEDVRAGRIALYAGSWGEDSKPESQLRHSTSAVDTAIARIGGKQKPKPQLQTYGADYKARMESKRLSKVLLGQFKMPRGRWQSTWGVTLQALWDAAVINGVIYVEENLDEECVDIKRILPIDVMFDEDDAADGNPTQMWVREAVNRWDLYERTKKRLSAPEKDEEAGESEEHEREEHGVGEEDDDEYEPEGNEDIELKKTRLLSAIESAKGRLFDSRASNATLARGTSEEIWVWTCYRRKTTKKSEGCKVVCLQDGTVLHRECFNSRRLPVVVLNWVDPVGGMWGDTMTDLQEVPQFIANSTYGNMRDNARALSAAFILKRRTSPMSDLEEDAEEEQEQLLSNANARIVEYSGDTPPQVVAPPIFNQQVYDFAERQRQFCFDIPGINELASQGKKSAGVTSGIGMRNENQLQDQRFLKQARMYEEAHPAIGHLVLDAIQRMNDKGIKVQTWLPSEGLIGEIDWKSIRPDGDDLYTIAIDAGNAFVDTVAQRQEHVEELRATGQIPADVALRLRLSTDPDLETYYNRHFGQWNWVERLIYNIHSEKDDVDIQVPTPDPMWDLALASLQIKDAYMECGAWEGCPENKLAALREFYFACIDMINQVQAQTPAPGDTVAPPTAGGIPPEGGAMPPTGAPPMMN